MSKLDREEKVSSLLGLLAFVPAGKATVTVQGHPMISIDADSKTVEVEADGVGEAGLHLSDLVKVEEGTSSMIQGSMHVTGALSHMGWKLVLFAGGERILTMGSGTSRLTGHISVNPLRLKKLLDVLR
jgi:hypothetical protein